MKQWRWRPGSDARWKSNVVCSVCARGKHLCSCCLLDLDYSVPVAVRDAALGESSTGVALMPQSGVNREYYVQQLEESIKSGEFDAQTKNRSRPSELLNQLQRSTPNYGRNKAKLCSFFAKGTCTRGDECPFRHELPDEVYKDKSLAKQNIKDRYHGTNDPVAEKMLRRARGAPSLKDFPEDRSICTMYVGGLPEGGAVSEKDLLDHFYAFGEVKAIRKSEAKRCAFVTFATRAMAEEAARTHAETGLTVKGTKLRMMWGRPSAPRAGGKRPPPQQQQQQQHPAPYPSMDPSQMGAAPRAKRAKQEGQEGS